MTDGEGNRIGVSVAARSFALGERRASGSATAPGETVGREWCWGSATSRASTIRASSAAGLFGSQLGVQLREQVGVLIGRQHPPILRQVPQRLQARAGEPREGEAARRIDDFDQAAFQQRADRGPIQLGLALVGAGGPAVQPDAVVERIGLPAARPEFRADQAALGGGERGVIRRSRGRGPRAWDAGDRRRAARSSRAGDLIGGIGRTAPVASRRPKSATARAAAAVRPAPGRRPPPATP